MAERDPVLARSLLSTMYLEADSPDVLARTSELLVDDAPTDWPDGARGDFLRELAPAALVAAREYGLPPSVTLAQAILESGWGKSRLARDYNNLFGMKAPKGSRSVATTTREGRGRWTDARFRIYSDWTESLAHHQALLSESPRYANARAYAADWRGYLKRLAPIYATSRTYSGQIAGLIERYDLDRWDALVSEAARASDDEALAMAITAPRGAID